MNLNLTSTIMIGFSAFILYNTANFFYYYLFICLLFFLNKYYISNRYINTMLSESNMIIRLYIPIICLLFDFNQIILCLVKFIFIITVRKYFSDKINSYSIIFTFIICLSSSFVYPIISLCMLEFYILGKNPLGMLPRNQHHLPDWLYRAQQAHDFQEHQRNLQEMLKNTEHGTNYNETIPADINDFNIAKANNAFNDLEKDTRGFHGRHVIGHIAYNILPKIKDETYINDGSPIHAKFTYKELAVLKYFGKQFNLENTPGYNGIVQHGPFTDTEPYSIEITQSISLNSAFGNRFQTEVLKYKKDINDWIKESNNKTWKLIK